MSKDNISAKQVVGAMVLAASLYTIPVAGLVAVVKLNPPETTQGK